LNSHINSDYYGFAERMGNDLGTLPRPSFYPVQVAMLRLERLIS
jgi:hypothetical protein